MLCKFDSFFFAFLILHIFYCVFLHYPASNLNQWFTKYGIIGRSYCSAQYKYQEFARCWRLCSHVCVHVFYPCIVISVVNICLPYLFAVFWAFRLTKLNTTLSSFKVIGRVDTSLGQMQTAIAGFNPTPLTSIISNYDNAAICKLLYIFHL